MKNIKEIGLAAFPDYRGRKYREASKGMITFYNTNWGGGSRNQYRAVNLENGKVVPFPDLSPVCNPIEGKSIVIPPGAAIVEHSIFCGKDMGLTIFFPPAISEKGGNSI